MKASESPYAQIEAIPTNLKSLDAILGVGGIPTRKITEISGVYSVGKTTLGLLLVASAQKQGRECLWADTEMSFDGRYAEKMGVELAQLDLVQATKMEERFAEYYLDEIETWCRSHKNGLICLDSVGGLLPSQEAEKTASEKTIGGQAKLVATFCRKISAIIAINNHALVVLNHQFTDLMTGRLKTSGGAKLEYTKSLHLMLRKMPKKVTKNGEQIGDVIEVEIRKNKVGDTLHKTTQLVLLYGEGFSQAADKLEEMIASGEITKKGNTYYHGERKIGVGAAAAREYLKTLQSHQVAVGTE